MIFEKLQKDFTEKNFMNILEASQIKDDSKIKRLMKLLPSKENEEYQFLICCLSDESFLNIIQADGFFTTEKLFARICLIKDEILKIYYLENLPKKNLYIMLALSLKNITLRNKYMKRVGYQSMMDFIRFLKNKELILRILPYIYEIDIIEYFGLKLKIEAPKSLDYRALINTITKLDNTEKKIALIKKCFFFENFATDVIQNTPDLQERQFLIKSLFDIKNTDIYKPDYNRCFEIPNYISALPPNLQFGVEIECYGDNARPILLYSKKLLGYDVKKESSLPDGLEFTSPILSWNYKDLNTIYQVCDFAKENDLTCFKRSGGHIHFSSDFLDSKSAWFWFLYLYSKVEMILYKICNPCGESPRQNIMKMALPFSKTYVDNYDTFKNIKDKDNFIRAVQNIFYKRYTGINLLNIFVKFNTIEFRMPNGTVDADEILLRILLFGNLLVLAKKLSVLPLEKQLHSLIYKIDNTEIETEKLEILLNLLFTSEQEKEIFRKRYYANQVIDDERDLAANMKTLNFQQKGIIV